LNPERIRVIAICVFRIGDSILVLEGNDTTEGSPFYRPPGGEVEFGETTEEAIKREIQEELALEVKDIRLLGVLENIFTYEGETGHEIVYVYDGHFADESAYEKEVFELREDNGEIWKARWRKQDFFSAYHRLVPEGLAELLKNTG